MGEASERAVKAGATPEQQAKANALGVIPGATEYLDLLLGRFGSAGKAMSVLGQAGVRFGLGAFTNAGQEGFQQFLQNWITKTTYKPEQSLGEEVAYNALIGGLVGGPVSTVLGGKFEKPEAALPPQTEEETVQGVVRDLGLPPEGGGPKGPPPGGEQLPLPFIDPVTGAQIGTPLIEPTPIDSIKFGQPRDLYNTVPNDATVDPLGRTIPTQITVHPQQRSEIPSPQPEHGDFEQPGREESAALAQKPLAEQLQASVAALPQVTMTDETPDPVRVGQQTARIRIGPQTPQQPVPVPVPQPTADDVPQPTPRTAPPEAAPAGEIQPRESSMIGHNQPPESIHENPEWYYSEALRQGQERLPTTGTAAQMWNTLRQSSGVKLEELEWMGVRRWLEAEDEAGRTINKQDLLDYMEERAIKVETVVAGGKPAPDPVFQETKNPRPNRLPGLGEGQNWVPFPDNHTPFQRNSPDAELLRMWWSPRH